MRALLAVLGLVVTAGSASAEPAVVDVCAVTDQRLEELSGLASDGGRWFAVNDSDNGRLEIQVLDRTCAITRTITAPTNPFDVEDLALAPDGTLWAADTGDNGKTRETVALHAVSPDGSTRLHRLTYPDGKHDAEALLIDGSGIPHIVTKETIGSALVYRPAAALNEGAPTPLEQVARVSISTTTTTGGPLSNSVVTRLVTGGAMSRDGRVAALRTYTDAYLFPVPDGDLAKALESDPVRVPLPGEPQGEAIAFDPDGTLLSASEFGRDGTSSTVRAVAGAAALTVPPPPTTTTTTDAPAAASGEPAPPADEPGSPWPVVGGGAVALVLVGALVRRSRRRRP
ncbi:esterase-like activity of phytase family protein [Saccharothrix sp. S26]|uniref:esterase-like activity of phytase family protein n=1 Tax=Saccharothrix sp. S26 TaxID=2907215 RepID=UPI001F3293D3|nr:esterase-like activity of phytase family protein [Saccharothrix sp. S26]MCE6997639.1 esterase-like activity of phytase family protein [Saccharothrix sp. S26]